MVLNQTRRGLARRRLSRGAVPLLVNAAALDWHPLDGHVDLDAHHDATSMNMDPNMMIGMVSWAGDTCLDPRAVEVYQVRPAQVVVVCCGADYALATVGQTVVVFVRDDEVGEEVEELMEDSHEDSMADLDDWVSMEEDKGGRLVLDCAPKVDILTSRLFTTMCSDCPFLLFNTQMTVAFVVLRNIRVSDQLNFHLVVVGEAIFLFHVPGAMYLQAEAVFGSRREMVVDEVGSVDLIFAQELCMVTCCAIVVTKSRS